MEEQTRTRIFSPSSKPHIGIIGAGVSGLRCADILLQHGFKVTIFEARDRVGGRVHQTTLPNGHVVDLGPNFIHGTVDNPILDLAKETGTTLDDEDDQSNVFDEDGKMLSPKQAEEISTITWDIVSEAFQYANEKDREIDTGESLADFFAWKVKEKILETQEGYQEKRKMVLQMSELWGAYVGTRIERQSLKFFWLEECIDGENLFCAGTYTKILKAIAKPALAGADVKLNTTIRKVTYPPFSQKGVKVETAGAETFSFDEVVVTTPLGWLKRNTASAFEPDLPPRLLKAIDAIGYGCLEKVYITFPKAFWQTRGDDSQKIKGLIQYLSPNYAIDSNPQRWNQEVVDLASLPSDVRHPTLLFYIYGAQSERITTKVAELASQTERDEFLFDAFKPYYSRLPNFDEASSDCRPTGSATTGWLRDELAGFGSYSNFQVGLEDGGEDIKTMRRGLPDQSLWFAGEHTAPFVGLGTATGAYWSGEAVARRIAASYGQAPPPEPTNEGLAA